METKKAKVLVIEQTRKTCTPIASKLKVKHLKKVKNFLVKQIQLDSFRSELKALNSKKNSNSRRLKNLTPFVDENDLLCVRGRVNVDVDSLFNNHLPILGSKHNNTITRFFIL